MSIFLLLLSFAVTAAFYYAGAPHWPQPWRSLSSYGCGFLVAAAILNLVGFFK